MKLATLFFGFFIVFSFIESTFCAEEAGNLETICYRQVQINPTQGPSLGPKCRVDGDVFYFEGAVTEEMYYEITVNYPNIKKIEFNSYGGLVNVAMRLAPYIREHHIATNVREGAKCASACTLLYQAGVIRTAHHSVRFLYHAPHLSEDWKLLFDESEYADSPAVQLEFIDKEISAINLETEAFFKKLEEYGLSKELFIDYKKLPNDNDWYQKGKFFQKIDYIIGFDKLKEYNAVQFESI